MAANGGCGHCGEKRQTAGRPISPSDIMQLRDVSPYQTKKESTMTPVEQSTMALKIFTATSELDSQSYSVLQTLLTTQSNLFDIRDKLVPILKDLPVGEINAVIQMAAGRVKVDDQVVTVASILNEIPKDADGKQYAADVAAVLRTALSLRPAQSNDLPAKLQELLKARGLKTAQ